MCGRFNVDKSNKEIDQFLAALPSDSPPVKLGEVAPTDTALVLGLFENAIQPRAMSWGFPRWDGKGVIFNARAESALQKPIFRKALQQHPAVIPTTGFFEWRPLPDQKRKEKLLFQAPTPVLYLAGFWNVFPDEAIASHFTILTTSANPAMLPFHHRMPVTLDAREIGAWLAGDILKEVLRREPEPLLAQSCAGQHGKL